MKNYMEVGEKGTYNHATYKCIEDTDGTGCDKCDLNKSKMKITDNAGRTICDCIFCDKGRPDGKRVYFKKVGERPRQYGGHSHGKKNK